MAKSKSTLKASFEDFKGIDLQKTHTGKISCSDMTNFRIMPDGSLKKRCGFKPVYTSDRTIRDVWSGMLNGEFVYIVVILTDVYKLDIEAGTLKRLGSVWSAYNRVSFFFFVDTLYIKDSLAIYKVTSSSVSPTKGYVPLYGKDWPTTLHGEINEPLNLLNINARISYKIPANNSLMLPTKLKVTYVHSLYRNGNLLSSSEYEIDSQYNTINVKTLAPGDEFLAVVQFDVSDPEINNLKLQFGKNNHSKVYSDIKNSRVFWWGASPGNTVFTNTPISPEAYAESEKYFPGAGPLYIAPGAEFVFGDGKSNVKAMLTHYDRLLIFTDGDAWMVDSSILTDQNTPVKAINSVAGSAASGGAAMAGNDPVTVGKQTIFRWTSDTDEFNQCNAYSISDAINEKLNESFFNNAMIFNDIYKNELWFRDPNGDDSVWIYNIDKRHWFKYSGINANFFFDANGKVGFSDGTSIYVFSDELLSDIDSEGNENEIVATFESGIIDFEAPEKKRLLELRAVGELNGGTLDIDLELDTGENVSMEITSSGTHGNMTKRLSSGRFSNLKMRITSAGKSDETIHSVCLSANPKK